MKLTRHVWLTRLAMVFGILLAVRGTATAASVILQNFSGIGQTDFVPSDMGGAVGANYVMQIINGGMRITDKTGVVAQAQITDTQFWLNAGIPTGVTNPGLSDPRVIYDPASQRFIVSEINVNTTNNVGNTVLLAVSNTSDPRAGFKAVSFPGYTKGTGPLADFPTLGVDANSIYVGSNNFNGNGFSSVSLFAIPKTDFISTQSLAGLTRFDGLNADTVGFTLQGVNSTAATSKIVAVDNVAFGVIDVTSVIGAGAAGATLSATTKLTGILDGSPNAQRQPNGTRTLDGGDDRFSSAVFQAGGFIYIANTIGDSNNISTHDSVHWLILNASTNAVVAQGQITDAAFDFTYPSIAANANGDFLIAYNRSGPTAPGGYVSAYGDVCHFDSVTSAVSCETPLLLKAGTTSYTERNQRWGDYSAAQVDPTNPLDFWAFTDYPADANNFATQITEIGPAAVAPVPEPGTFLLTAIPAIAIWLRRRKH